MKLLMIGLVILLCGACQEKTAAQREALLGPGGKGRMPTPQERQVVVDKHREAATAMLKRLRAIGQEAMAAGPVQAREPTTVAGPLQITLLDNVSFKVGDQVLLANAELLASDTFWTNTAKVKLNGPATFARKLEEAMQRGWDGPMDTADSVEQRFTAWTGLQYAFIVRVRDYQPPKMATGERFEAGRASGDVLLYDLATGKRAGGFPFEAGQSDEASVRGKSVQADLVSSFVIGLEFTLKAEAAAYLAGKPGPASPGAAAQHDQEKFADKIRNAIAVETLGSGIEHIEITAAAGKITVTIHADNPLGLADRDGKVAPAIVDKVRQILGADADVKAVASKAGRAPLP